MTSAWYAPYTTVTSLPSAFYQRSQRSLSLCLGALCGKDSLGDDRSYETNPIAGGPVPCEESDHDSIGSGKCGIVPWIDGAAGG